jgi:hypothetical protein
MTFAAQLRRHVREAIDAARSRAAGRRGRVRVVKPTNIVVARNIDGQGQTQRASASQTVAVRDGAVQERSERTGMFTSGPNSIDQRGKERKDP